MEKAQYEVSIRLKSARNDINPFFLHKDNGYEAGVFSAAVVDKLRNGLAFPVDSFSFGTFPQAVKTGPVILRTDTESKVGVI